jgi:hypothetical protein
VQAGECFRTMKFEAESLKKLLEILRSNFSGRKKA